MFFKSCPKFISNDSDRHTIKLAKNNASQRFILLSEKDRPFYFSDFISSLTYLLRFLERSFEYQWTYVATFSELLGDEFPATVHRQFITTNASKDASLAAAKEEREINASQKNNNNFYSGVKPVHAYNSPIPLFGQKRNLPPEENPGNKKMKIEFLCN